MQPIDAYTDEQIRGMSVIQLRAAITGDPRMANLMDIYNRAALQEGIIATLAASRPAPRKAKAEPVTPPAPAAEEVTPDVAPPAVATAAEETAAAEAAQAAVPPESTDPVIAAAQKPPAGAKGRDGGFPHKQRG